MRLPVFVLSVIGIVGVAACASTAASENEERGIAAFKDDPRLGGEVSKICFNRTIDGFSNATKDTVVLGAGPSKDYIVEVSGVCQNLRFAQSIAIDSSLSCITRNDHLIVSDSAFALEDRSGLGVDRCMIKKMHKWDRDADEETDQDL